MIVRRRLAISLVVFAAAALAEPRHDYFPVAAEARMEYQSHAAFNDEALQWTVRPLRSEAVGERVATVELRTETGFYGERRPVQRNDRFVIEPRGVFLAQREGNYGPLPLLPGAEKLARVDAVWRFDGERPLPFGFFLLRSLVGDLAQPVPTSGRYHVLNHEAVETAAGTFPEAVQVVAIERVRITLTHGEELDLMLRCRRWYARGVGLVKELIEFTDYPRLGRLSTELRGYEGLTPAQEPAGTAVEAPANRRPAA